MFLEELQNRGVLYEKGAEVLPQVVGDFELVGYTKIVHDREENEVVDQLLLVQPCRRTPNRLPHSLQRLRRCSLSLYVANAIEVRARVGKIIDDLLRRVKLLLRTRQLLQLLEVLDAITARLRQVVKSKLRFERINPLSQLLVRQIVALLKD